MKIRFSLLALLSALLVLPDVRSADKEPETELGKHMENMSGPFRRLRRQISSPDKNADSLAALAVIRENAEAGLKLEPVMKSEIPAEKQAQFVADYREKLKALIDLTNKVEAALKAGNNAEAEKLVGAMADAQKQGHKDFKKKDKK